MGRGVVTELEAVGDGLAVAPVWLAPVSLAVADGRAASMGLAVDDEPAADGPTGSGR
jgi:hypothetical protein